jgi:hypothetical protein
MTDDKLFTRSGLVWRCYGLTKTHFWGVSITSSFFLLTGALLAIYAIDAPDEDRLLLLLFAICSLLVCCSTLLYSILTLLFYIGNKLFNDNRDSAS